MFVLNQTYSTAEFVNELGISMDSWKRKTTREKYLNYLKDFIEFEVSTKGRSNFYTVTAIYADYTKPNFKKVPVILNQIRDSFDAVWKTNEPETCTRVATIMIQQQLVDTNSMYGVVKKVSEVRTEKFGKPGSAGGPKGKCYYIRAKLFRNQAKPLYYDQDNQPVWDASKFTYATLTLEEKQKLCQIHMKYYPNDIERIDNLREKLQKNEIKTVEEVADCILEQDLSKAERSQKFLEYTAELAAAFGCDWIVRATMVEESIFPCIDTAASFEF